MLFIATDIYIPYMINFPCQEGEKTKQNKNKENQKQNYRQDEEKEVEDR